MNDNGILFLTQRFPPHQGAAARRFRHLAEQFATERPVYVIRAGKAADTLDYVHREWAIPTHDLRYYTMGEDRTTVPIRLKKKAPIRQFLRMRQAFPFVHLLDDGGPAYRKRALTLATDLVRAEKIDTVFSSYQPWSDHLVAGELKRLFPELNWIADFRDLPVDPIRRDVWWPALQRWWGKRMIRRANEVWCVSLGQAEQMRGWHPRVMVRRNALKELPPVRSAPVTDKFSIVYTGSLYPKLQSIKPLVTVLLKLLATGELSATDCCLVYRGKDADLWRQWTASLPETMLDTGEVVPTKTAEELQKQAQLLLLLTWSAKNYFGVLTAKLYDYLAAGRPILALVNGPGDKELEDILSQSEAGGSFSTADNQLAAFVLDRYRTWQREGTVAHRSNRAYLSQYRLHQNAKLVLPQTVGESPTIGR